MKHPSNRIAAAAAAVIAVGALTACDPASGNNSADSESPSPSQPTQQPSEPTTPRGQAIAQAKQLTRDYYEFRKDATASPKGVDLDEFSAYLVGDELTQQQSDLREWAKQGYYTDDGAGTFRWMRVTKASVNEATGKATVTLKVCYDTNDVIAYDPQDRPIDKISPLPATVQLQSPNYAEGNTWRIKTEELQKEQCS